MKIKRVLALSVVLLFAFSIMASAIEIPTVSPVTSYYDFDFDQAGDSDNSWTNKAAGSTFPFGFVDGGHGTSPSAVLVDDAEKNSKVLKVTMPSGGAEGGYLALGTSQDISGLDSLVTWYELSFKFDGTVTGLSLANWNNFFEITTDGSFYVGGLKDFSLAPGTKVTNFTAQADEWYKLVMAVDFVDAVNGSPKLYAWINGNLLSTGTSEECTMVWDTSTVLPKGTIDDYSLRMPSATAGVVSFDDIKLYTSNKKVNSTTKYYDYNFDRAGENSGNWTNGAGSGYNFNYILNNTTSSNVVQDIETGSNVLKMELGTNQSVLGQSVMNIGNLDNTVTWYEMSLKFENKISDTSLRTGNNFFNILADGSLLVGGIDFWAFQGTKVTNFTATTDKWYHLVMAVDYLDVVNGNPKLYVWINGELMKVDSSNNNYTMLWSTTTGYGATNLLDAYTLYLTGNNSNVYLDNVKLYTNDASVSESGYDASAIMAGTSLTTDLLLEDDTLYVEKETTLADVKKAVSAAGAVKFFNGSALVSDGELATTSAIGKKICVVSTGGIGVKTYKIEKKPAVMIAENYYDVNFNSNSNTNTANGSYTFAPLVGGNFITYTADAVKGNGVAMCAPTTYSRVGMSTVGVTGLESRTTWYELSFRYDKEIFTAKLLTGAPIFQFGSDGKIYLGGFKDFSGGDGYVVDNATLETGKWYNLKIAVDWIDSLTAEDLVTYPRFYAWLNGELLTTGTASDCTLVWENAINSAYNRTSIQWLELDIEQPTISGANLKLDDFKIYTTKSAVRNAEGNIAVDFSDDFAQVGSQTVGVAGGEIYAPKDATLGDVVSALTLANAGKILDETGTEVAAQNTTPANGKTIYIQSANGVGVGTYTISEQRTSVETATAKWTVSTNSSVLTIDVLNATADVKNNVLILAVYDKTSGQLLASSVTPVELSVGHNEIIANALAIDSFTNCNVRAFLWSSMSTLTPVIPDVTIPTE